MIFVVICISKLYEFFDIKLNSFIISFYTMRIINVFKKKNLLKKHKSLIGYFPMSYSCSNGIVVIHLIINKISELL